MNTLKEQLEAAYGLSRSPQYQAKRCTARKSRGETCNVCAEICPEKVFPSGKRKHPTWDACSHCGLCAASCPARCITPPVDRVKSFLMAVAKPGPLTLGCDAYEHTFRLSIFLSGTVGNAAIAVFLTWLGQKLGIPLYLAAVVVFGTRMFQNFAEIRRELLTSKQKRDKIEQDIVPPASGDTK